MGIKVEVELSENAIEEIVKRVKAKDNKKPNKAVTPLKTYTLSEVAKILKVGNTTVVRHIKNGLIKATKPGQSYIITHENLTQYLNNNLKI